MDLIKRIVSHISALVTNKKPQVDSPKVEVTYRCNVSPFNSQYNAMSCEYARMDRAGASKEELKQFLRDYRITSLEGQLKSPYRFPTQEEHFRINAQVLARA